MFWEYEKWTWLILNQFLSYFTQALTPYLLHQFFKRGHLALQGLFFFLLFFPNPRKYSNHNIFTRKEWQHLNLLQHSMRVTRGGKQVCEEGCAVRGAGTAIHLLFHLQGNVRSWQKGSTPRHYFRHNIRPMHAIKQWQHLNSHRTSTYPLSLNNESEEEATFFFSYTKDNLQKQWEENVIHIGEYFKKDMCLHCHCAKLVAGGSANPGQITQRSSPLPRKRVLPAPDAPCDIIFKMEPRPFCKWLNYSV